MSQLVVFKLNKESYALPVQQVREITKLNGITPLPDSPSVFKGIIDLRGQALPVLDLHKRLGLTRSHCEIALIAEFAGVTLGLAVDEVLEVSELGVPQVPPQVVSTPCVTGIINLPDRLVMVLNLSSIISEEEKIDLQHLSEIG